MSFIVREETLKPSLLGKLLTLLLLLLVAADMGLGPQAQRKRRKPKDPEPFRLGIYHPHPALCPGDEASQRDLRVLRLAFDVGQYPRQWRSLPWFYSSMKKPGRKKVAPKAPLQIVLNTRRLWGQRIAPENRPENGKAPKGGPYISPALLQSWRNRSGALLNGTMRPPAAGADRALLAAPIPFLATRLVQTRNLPYLSQPNPDPTAEPATFPDCRSWPKGIAFDLSGKGPGLRGSPLSYFMTGPANKRGKPFVLLAFKDAGKMWGEYLSERLDALLLESTIFQKRLKNLDDDILGPWGLILGGQQIVLRFSPRMMKQLTVENRKAISMALNRKDMAKGIGERRFSASRGFMNPLLPRKFRSGLNVLRWNSREARKEWVKNNNKPEELSLGVLDHPWLLEIADRIQAHLNRTINLPLTITTFPVDQFQRLLESWKTDLTLEVVDLEDGSLQNLWLSELGTPEAVPAGLPNPAAPGKNSPPNRSVNALEIELRGRLPYLPLLINNHYVLLRKKPPRYMFWRICSGCQRIPSPMQLKKKKARILSEG